MMANDMKHVLNGMTKKDKGAHHKLFVRTLAIGAVTAATMFGTVAQAAGADQATNPQGTSQQGTMPQGASQPGTGQQGTAGQQGTGAKTFVQDSMITSKVKAKLASEQISTLAKIKVDTDNKGVVVLSGNVKSQEEADKAVQIAQNTEGVTLVQNMLQIKNEPGKY